jgi:glycine C-acetyltransferase
MVKDLFEKIQNNKGPLGKMGYKLKVILYFPSRRRTGPRMKFHGKDILNWV